MIAGGGSTTDYWELEKQAQWLGKRGEKQKTRPTYEKVVHNKAWRFYPSKSKGKSIGSTFDSDGYSKTLVQEYIERKQRKKRPRTLRPIPFPAKAPVMAGGQSLQSRLSPPGMYGRPSPNNMSSTFPNYNQRGGGRDDMTEKLIQNSNLLGMSDVYGHLHSSNNNNQGSPYGGGGLSPNSDSSFAGEYGQVQDKKRWAQHQSVIEEAVTSQLRRYKAENRALRKQKRATLYILRLLEQKILDLSGSDVQVEPIDPTAAGYEMHPDVYSILKGEVDIKARSMVAVNANDFKEREKGDENENTGTNVEERDDAIAEADNNMIMTSTTEVPQVVENDIPITSKNDQEIVNEETDAIEELSKADEKEEVEKESQVILESKEKLKEIFVAIDSSSNGSLSKREFRRAIFKRPDLGQFITIANFQKTFEEMDTDKNGLITYIEFEEYCLKDLRAKESKKSNNENDSSASSAKKLMQQELRDIFDSMDINKNGTLEKKEFKKAILLSPKLGKFLKITSFDESFNTMDTNHDTLITYGEFENFCLKDVILSLEELDDPYASDRVLLRSIFTDLDANKNNLLEKREFRRAVQRRPDLGSFLRPRDFLKSFKAMDTSSDGAISVDEFVSFCINAKYKYLEKIASPKNDRSSTSYSLPPME